MAVIVVMVKDYFEGPLRMCWGGGLDDAGRCRGSWKGC